MITVLAGYGEVGKGIHKAWSRYHGMLIHDPTLGFVVNPPNCGKPIDVLLIAFPYGDNFVKQVQDLQGLFKPISTIVFSTVPIGTCRQVDAVHSPVEGLHDQMDRYLRVHQRWIGGIDENAEKFFEECDLPMIVVLEAPEHTEFLKLRSLAVYGVNIELARWSDFGAAQVGMDYKIVKQYDTDYNNLNRVMGKGDKYCRYVLDPPVGPIGGHCILPNMKLLNEQMFHPFFDLTLSMQEAWEKNLQEPETDDED